MFSEIQGRVVISSEMYGYYKKGNRVASGDRPTVSQRMERHDGGLRKATGDSEHKQSPRAFIHPKFCA